jgi:dTMP kinase
MRSRRFVSVEGIDGCGKSTQAAMLADALERAGETVVRTREPGGTALGEAVRALLLDTGQGDIAPVTEMYLFAAARAELVREVIAPALSRGAWVVADRFLDSSLAYQGAARGLGIARVLQVNAAAVDGHMPGATLLIDLPDDVAAGRRRAGADRIEAEGPDFHAAVAAGYAEIAQRFPVRTHRIDGSGSAEQVHRRIMAVVDELRGRDPA